MSEAVGAAPCGAGRPWAVRPADSDCAGLASRAARARGRRYPGAVRLTVFWEKMRGQFGEAYAASVAKDYVLTGLGGATVNQALAAGKEPKTVWLAVCEAFEIPEEAR